MRLTMKDLWSTIAVAAVVAGYLAFVAGSDAPVVSSTRWLAAGTLVVGLFACGTGAGAALGPGAKLSAMTWLAVLLGTVALFAGVITIITGSEAGLAVLVAMTVLLWLMTTLRHLFTPVRPAVRH